MIVIHAPNCKIKIPLRLGWATRTFRTIKRMTHHAPMNCVLYMSTTTLLSFNMKKNPWFCCIMKHNLKVWLVTSCTKTLLPKGSSLTCCYSFATFLACNISFKTIIISRKSTIRWPYPKWRRKSLNELTNLLIVKWPLSHKKWFI